MTDNNPAGAGLEMLGKYTAGEASPEEAIQAEEWIKASNENREMFQQVCLIWNSASGQKGHELPPREEVFREIKRNLVKANKNRTPQAKIILYMTGVAASVLFIISAALIFSIPQTKTVKGVNYITRLTGKFILSDTLPDKSQVILNSNSLIRYPDHFNGIKRELALSGEAWFSVTHNSMMPFIISVGDVHIEVTSTAFNIRQNSSTIETAVKSGSVVMYCKSGRLSLKAGQKGIYNTGNNKFTLENYFNSNDISYATRIFNFENTSLKEISRQMEKAYGVNIFFGNEKLQKCTISSSFDNKTLRYILDVISVTLNIHYRIENQNIYFYGAGCDE